MTDKTAFPKLMHRLGFYTAMRQNDPAAAKAAAKVIALAKDAYKEHSTSFVDILKLYPEEAATLAIVMLEHGTNSSEVIDSSKYQFTWEEIQGIEIPSNQKLLCRHETILNDRDYQIQTRSLLSIFDYAWLITIFFINQLKVGEAAPKRLYVGDYSYIEIQKGHKKAFDMILFHDDAMELFADTDISFKADNWFYEAMQIFDTICIFIRRKITYVNQSWDHITRRNRQLVMSRTYLPDQGAYQPDAVSFYAQFVLGGLWPESATTIYEFSQVYGLPNELTAKLSKLHPNISEFSNLLKIYS